MPKQSSVTPPSKPRDRRPPEPSPLLDGRPKQDPDLAALLMLLTLAQRTVARDVINRLAAKLNDPTDYLVDRRTLNKGRPSLLYRVSYRTSGEEQTFQDLESAAKALGLGTHSLRQYLSKGGGRHYRVKDDDVVTVERISV